MLSNYKRILIKILTIIILGGCASQKNRHFSKNVLAPLENAVFENHFKGIFIIDPISRDTLLAKNSDKYFTPASNTKIYTLFAALNMLPEKLPALRYAKNADTLFISGMADGTQLHPYFKDSTILNFLKNHKTIALVAPILEDARMGPGWSWDDYHWYYSAERNALPLYGNVLTYTKYPEPQVHPEYFRDSISYDTVQYNRALSRNAFYIDPERKDTLEIPYITGEGLSRKLLEAALAKTIYQADKMPDNAKTLYGLASDSICKRMMQISDNFLAEQLLIQASTTVSDTLSGAKTRAYVLDSLLPDLRQPPRWVDGSGLSRYNLFTPESIVHVLDKMYRTIPRDRLLNIFAVGGESGTLIDWYPGNPTPYIYAKTGSLGNNHCVSGYLITNSGKTLIFSFMNNHFRRSSAEIKLQMQQAFQWIRDNY